MAKKYLYISHLATLIAAENVKRRKNGLPPLSQKELEQGTGVTRQALSRWRETEKPLTSVKQSTVEGLMRFFGVSEEELYTRVEIDLVAPGERAFQTIEAR